MGVAFRQVVSDSHPDGAETRVAHVSQRPAAVDLIALIARGEQTRAAGNRLGAGVMFDRPHLAGQFAGGNDADAGMRKQQNIRRFHEDFGDLAFQLGHLLGLDPPVVVERLPNAGQVRRQRIGVGRVDGPRQHLSQSGRMVTYPFFLQPALHARQACRPQGSGGARASREAQRKILLPEIVVGEQGRVARQAYEALLVCSS